MKHSIAALSCALIAAGCLQTQNASAQSQRPLLRAYKATLLLNPVSQAQFVAHDFNNVGQIAGEVDRADLPGAQAAIWRNGNVNPLPDLEGTVSSTALALNERGDAVESTQARRLRASSGTGTPCNPWGHPIRTGTSFPRG